MMWRTAFSCRWPIGPIAPRCERSLARAAWEAPNSVAAWVISPPRAHRTAIAVSASVAAQW